MLEPEDELGWELLKRKIPGMTRDSLEKKCSELIDYHVARYQEILADNKERRREIQALKAELKKIYSALEFIDTEFASLETKINSKKDQDEL